MVHQHFMLADNLTVLENVVLGAEKLARHRLPTPAPRSSRSPTPYGLGVEPDELVEELGVGDRQRVEILKVLYRGARIVILDEPTAVLVPQEVDELFGNLRELKSEGLAVIFISHKLDEVLSVADVITVIRRGTTVDTVDPASVTAHQLAELMVGAELPSPEHRDSTVTDEVLISVRAPEPADARGSPAARRHLLRPSTRERCSASPASRATARRSWSRRSWACCPAATGAVSRGRAGHLRTGPRAQRREAGIGYIPEDRHRHGLLLDAPLWENRILGHQTSKPAAKGIFIDKKAARADTERIIEEYDVRTPGLDVLARGAVRRQPAEADRRARDEQQPGPADRRPPHPRCRRRRTGRDLGPHPGSPARRDWPCS